jgi:DNA-binding transcriptional regulator YiaG
VAFIAQFCTFTDCVLGDHIATLPVHTQPVNIAAAIREIRVNRELSKYLIDQLGTSWVSLDRWERGDTQPSPAQKKRILELHRAMGRLVSRSQNRQPNGFSSSGIRRATPLPLFQAAFKVEIASTALPPILTRLVWENISLL